MTDEPTRTGVIGTRLLRKEDPVLLTGEAVFANDMKVPGALHMAVLRSPYASATINSIDTSAAAGDARRAGGVHRRRPHRPVGGTDAVRLAGHRGHAEPAALSDRRPKAVHYVGDGVAVVLADSDADRPRRDRGDRRRVRPLTRRSSTSRTRCPTGCVVHADLGTNSSYTWDLQIEETDGAVQTRVRRRGVHRQRAVRPAAPDPDGDGTAGRRSPSRSRSAAT